MHCGNAPPPQDSPEGCPAGCAGQVFPSQILQSFRPQSYSACCFCSLSPVIPFSISLIFPPYAPSSLPFLLVDGSVTAQDNHYVFIYAMRDLMMEFCVHNGAQYPWISFPNLPISSTPPHAILAMYILLVGLFGALCWASSHSLFKNIKKSKYLL